MARRYELRQRAESQGRTRQRIVEAAVALHISVGPSRTTVSAIAERAGVQRHTFYRHFPDERSLALACSGLFNETHPLPDPSPWQTIASPEARLRQGLGELYRYYERNAEQLAPIIRDAEADPLIREILALRVMPTLDAMRDMLSRAFDETGPAHRRLRGVITTLLSFTTWRDLRAGLRSSAETIDAATRAILAQTSLRPPRDPR